MNPLTLTDLAVTDVREALDRIDGGVRELLESIEAGDLEALQDIASGVTTIRCIVLKGDEDGGDEPESGASDA